MDAQVTENNRNWRLKSLHVERFSGALGISIDGSVVGDYALESVDLTGL